MENRLFDFSDRIWDIAELGTVRIFVDNSMSADATRRFKMF